MKLDMFACKIYPFYYSFRMMMLL